MNKPIPHISVAPMMDWTDRHCRYFHRLLSPNARLYTEMVTTGAILHGDRDRLLAFNAEEHYVALQLGGSEPSDLKESVRIAEDYGYDEINLNCGCPSERVQKGAFGACLMAEPETVAACVRAMASVATVPVTVKCRIGIDDCDEFVMLRPFIQMVADAGCNIFIIHARKAWLKGLSPKENREIPPLNYKIPRQIKEEFPTLDIIVNGGIRTIEDTRTHLENFDGVMIGREAYQNPSFLLECEKKVFGTDTVPGKAEIVDRMADYIIKQNRDFGTPPKSVLRHMINLYQGERGAKHWRRALSEAGKITDTDCPRRFLHTAMSRLEHL